MKPKFLNRKEELEFLERKYREKGFQLIVIYGRRRVGKTDLITHFAREKDHVYFLANKRGSLLNSQRLAEKAASAFNDVVPRVDDFDGAFKYIAKRISDKRFVIVIDEFSYLIEKDAAVTSVFQLIVDELLKNTNAMVILCGSVISMMEEGLLSYKSPLYGRRTGQWKLMPLRIKDLPIFLNLGIENMIEYYSILGDIPAYLVQLNPEKEIFENIRERILKKGEFLYDEGRQLLVQELKEPDTYFDILLAMTKAAKPGDIADLAKIEAKDLPKYMKNLIKIELAEKIQLITEKSPKKTIYSIKDNFVNFWFKFVYPHFSDLEEGNIDYVLNLIKTAFNQHVSSCFEKFCLKMVRENLIRLPFKPDETGKQWGKFKGEKGKNAYEIDMVALNKQAKQILFAECKWQNKVNAEKVLAELKEKAAYVDWNKGKRKEYYAVFAKSFKEKIKQDNVYLFDLKDLNKILRK